MRGAALAIGGVRNLPDDDKAALEKAMHGFVFWSAIRAVCQIGAFAANVAALIR